MVHIKRRCFHCLDRMVRNQKIVREILELEDNAGNSKSLGDPESSVRFSEKPNNPLVKPAGFDGTNVLFFSKNRETRIALHEFKPSVLQLLARLLCKIA
jgi:hypothetical protein